jgi:carboxypeptidase C (cathepsin A)
MLEDLISDFKKLMTSYDVPKFSINAEYPYLYINQLQINVEDFSYTGNHDAITDAFRDFARRYGIRIYVPHGFKFNLTRK